MAELEQVPTTDQTDTTTSCCPPEARETCCEPTDKAACCGESTGGGSCGCSAGVSDT